MDEVDWKLNAICRNFDPDLWFEPYMEREVAKVCKGCPVKTMCLQVGLNEPYGVWGGLSAAQRKALRPRRAPVPVPPADYQRLYDLGMTDHQVAALKGVSPSTVGKWRAKGGLPPNKPKPRPVSPQKLQIIALLKSGRDPMLVAQEFGLSRSRVYEIRSRALREAI